MPTKLVINCETGVTEELELTPEEIAQAEADAQAFAAEQAIRQAEQDAKEAARQSALTKLAALGLTAEEAEAIIK